MSENIMTGLINEIDRCTEILKDARSIGHSGILLVNFLETDIKMGKEALASNDVVEVVNALRVLKDYKA